MLSTGLQRGIVQVASGITQFKENVVPNGLTLDPQIIRPTAMSQVAVTRAASETVIDSGGVLRTVPVYNQLILHTEDIATGSSPTSPWTVAGGYGSAAPVLDDNAATAPDGTLTATRVDFDALSTSNGYSVLYQSFVGTAVPHTLSFWAKTVSGTGTLYAYTYSAPQGTVYTSFSVTNTWKRFSVSRTLSATTWCIYFGPDASQGEPQPQPALSIYLWGVNVTDTASMVPYAKATTSTVTTSQLAVGSSGAQIYGAYDQLLLHTEDIATGSSPTSPWDILFGGGAGNPTVNANQAIAPDGTLTAAQINFPSISGSSQYSFLFQQASTTSGNYTMSFWARTVSGTGTLYINPQDTADHDSPVSLTTTWARFTKTASLGTYTSNFCIGPNGTTGNEPATQPALSIYLWGVNVTATPVAYPYVKAVGSIVSQPDTVVTIANPYYGINPSSWAVGVRAKMADWGTSPQFCFIGSSGANSAQLYASGPYAYFLIKNVSNESSYLGSNDSSYNLFAANSEHTIIGYFDGTEGHIYIDNILVDGTWNVTGTPGVSVMPSNITLGGGRVVLNGCLKKFVVGKTPQECLVQLNNL